MSCRSHASLLLLLLGLCHKFDASSGGSSKGMTFRENRFPSVEERVKIYMSNWYVPPCSEYQEGYFRFEYFHDEKKKWPKLLIHPIQNHPLVNGSSIIEVESILTADQLFFMDQQIIMNCANATFEGAAEKDKRQLEIATRVKFRHNMRMYCHDVRDSLFAAFRHVRWEADDDKNPGKRKLTAPTLLQFGDSKHSHIYGDVVIPHIKKFRSASITKQELSRVTSSECYSSPRDALSTLHGTAFNQFQPIVWKLATHRHFEKLYEVYQQDTPWYKKKDMGVFRGQLTGSREGYDKNVSDEQNCIKMKRCRLVYNNANSTLIDALLTNTRGRLPSVLNGVTLLAGKVDLGTLLEYKGIIMIEGNDVASGLKWALLSQSVVLMPPPKHTSWAMEELLEPWVVSAFLLQILTVKIIP
jgi:hypothetical protein